MESDPLWAPFIYLENIPGKNSRSAYIDAFNQVLQVPPTVVEPVKRLINRLHTASLLLDDIEDDATLRRGKPAAHKIFGTPRTMNTASFVMIQALKEACLQFPEAQGIIYEEILALHEGQGLEIFWRDTHMCPSEIEYIKMVSAKTGGLYRLGVRLLQRYSESHIDLVPLTDCSGLLYQIQDDYLNLVSSTYEHNKGFAEDISEGKFSFPIIHCLKTNHSVGSESRGILRLRTKDVSSKRHASEILDSSKSFDYTRHVVSGYVARAHVIIDELNVENPSVLHELVHRMTLIDLADQRAE